MRTTQLQNLFFHEKTLDRYTDESVLELLLTNAGITGDIPAMINGLYATFGSFKGIIEAMPEQLMTVPHITKRAAAIIAMVAPLSKIMERSNMENPRTIRSIADAEAYCKSLLMGERSEQFYMLALSCKCALLGCRKIADGSLTEVPAYPRKIVEAALTYNAWAVVLCHNHPSGSCIPSAEDIKTTKHLQKTLNAVGISVLDHLIVSGSNTYSMVQNNDISYGRSEQKNGKSKSKRKNEKEKRKKQ